MLIWLSTLSLALCFRIWTKSYERKAANRLIHSIYRGPNEKAVALAGSLIHRPTPEGEILHEAVRTVPPFSILKKFFYLLFAFSFGAIDARTPHAFTLLESEEKFYELHDPDIFETYRQWKAVFFWDGVSAGVLTLVLLSACSKTLFTLLYY